MKYTNTQQFNLGLKFMTGDPADDRLILNSSSDMFVNKNNTTEANSPLFNRAYAGMIVTVADEGYETYVCINDAPYRAKTKANVTAANLSTYWKRGDQTLYNYVHTEVDNYIRTPHIKVNSEWITCSSTLSTQGIKGIDYVFDASIDSNTLEVHGKKLSGWKYQIDKIKNPGDANYAEYQLQYWAPGATGWANDPIKIEIPKLQVLKEVRLCVAVPDSTSMGGYRVYTVEIEGEEVEVYRDAEGITEEIWKNAAADAESQGGGVYLRIEWDNDDTPPATAITYINVGEIITIDIDPLRKRLDSLESRGLVWDSSINELERRASVVDVSVNRLESSVYSYIPSAIKTINSSISALKDNDTSIINYINNDVSVNLYDKIDEVSAYIINTVIGEGGTGLTKQITDLNSSVGRLNSSVNNLETSVYSYLPPVINSINSSISALKDNDTSIINYINNDVSVYIHSEIEEVSAYIINTVIGGGTGISQQIANINSSISDVSNRVFDVSSRVDSNYSTLSSSIGQTYTTLNDVITNEVTTAIARVDVELADVSSRVENNYETLSTEISKTNLHIDASIQQLTTRLDSSLQEMVGFIKEDTQVFAASWAMFREKNPDLNWTDFPY